jgi:hypothetical protein
MPETERPARLAGRNGAEDETKHSENSDLFAALQALPMHLPIICRHWFGIDPEAVLS